jgi:hypothetical protein
VRRALVVVLLVASTHAYAQQAGSGSTAGSGSATATTSDTASGSDAAAGSDAVGSAATSPTPTPAPATPPQPPAPAETEKTEKTSTDQRLDAVHLCEQHDARCDWLETFSSFEKQSVARALAARGLQIDPQPWGKQIAHVRVYNEEVFAEPATGGGFWTGLYRVVRGVGNVVHYTTRERAVRDELAISAGDTWDDDKVAESARILHDPLYSSVVALLPVKATEPGKVDLLVVTRDVWSLRFNTQFAFQQSSLTNLSISISENNFLGNRDVLAAAALMDQGALAVGPLFIDKNFLGKHLDFRARVDTILTRQSLSAVSLMSTTPGSAQYVYTPSGDPKGWEDGGGYRNEGHDATISLSRPLWSLATEWGGGASFSYSNAIARSYLSTGIRAWDDPATPDLEAIPREYRYKTWSVGANAVRQWGSVLKQQLSIGYSVSSQHPSLLPNFSPDPMLRADFVRDVFPHDEVISQPYIEYTLFQPKYRTIRNFATYELAEDVRLGPDFDVSVAQALSPLGSTHTFTRPAISGGWTLPWARDGFVHPSAGTSLRIQSDGVHDTIDNTAQVSVRAGTPTLAWLHWVRLFRIVAQSTLETRWHDTQNAFYTIGSDSGLRGYPINAFYGERRFSTIVEARLSPVPLWMLRVGGVLFYEAGGAANSIREIKLYQDVGLGLRLLIPQTSRELLRFDMAVPLVPSPGNPIRPRFLLGFSSYF